MSGRYPIPARRHACELIVRRSRFVASAGPAASVEAARAFIESVKAEHPDATHHVYAFAVGHGASVTHGMSDAGEPSGTAGPPTLAVIKGSDLGDVAVVTARYYGGTKLGTGGLVRAYTEVAQAVLESLPRTERVETAHLRMRLPYPLYDPILRLLADMGAVVESAVFEADIIVEVALDAEDVDRLGAALADASAGSVSAVRIDEVGPSSPGAPGETV